MGAYTIRYFKTIVGVMHGETSWEAIDKFCSLNDGYIRKYVYASRVQKKKKVKKLNKKS